jgi:bile acid-coenzyme A ligase
VWLGLVGPEHFYFQYGGTEGIGATQARGDEWLTHEGTVGRPLGCDVRIQGSDGQPLGAGEVGEIFMRPLSGPPPFRYVGAPMPKRTPDGFSTFGDLGWLDDDGYLYVDGRTDDTIIRGGENIAPAEIEDVLLRHPAVLDAAVVGLPDEEWGQRVAAAVTLRPGTRADPAELSAWTRQHLRSSRAAEVVVVRDELPRTDTGKLLRRRVLEDMLQPSTQK